MRSKTKILALILAALALIAASIFGTMAYLTDTDAVTNTFTVGKVEIKLDEAVVDEYGNPLDGQGQKVDLGSAARTNESVSGNEYHLIPGHEYTKDPTVTVIAGSETSYIRMVVDVEYIDQLEAAIPEAENNVYYADLNDDSNSDFILQLLLKDSYNSQEWLYTSYTEKTVNVTDNQDNNVALTYQVGTYEFRYKETVNTYKDANGDEITEDKVLEPLFTTILIPGTLVDNADMVHLANVKVVVKAHAIQADGFNSADEAWVAFDGQMAAADN